MLRLALITAFLYATAASPGAASERISGGLQRCQILDTTVGGYMPVNSYRCRGSHTCRLTMLGIDLTGESYELIPFYRCRFVKATRYVR